MFEEWTDDSRWENFDPTGPDHDNHQFVSGGYRLRVSWKESIYELNTCAACGILDSLIILLAYGVGSLRSSSAGLQTTPQLTRWRGVSIQGYGGGPQNRSTGGHKKGFSRRAVQYARDNDYRYCECSSLTGEGTSELFNTAIHDGYTAMTPHSDVDGRRKRRAATGLVIGCAAEALL